MLSLVEMPVIAVALMGSEDDMGRLTVASPPSPEISEATVTVTTSVACTAVTTVTMIMLSLTEVIDSEGRISVVIHGRSSLAPVALVVCGKSDVSTET